TRAAAVGGAGPGGAAPRGCARQVPGAGGGGGRALLGGGGGEPRRVRASAHHGGRRRHRPRAGARERRRRRLCRPWPQSRSSRRRQRTLRERNTIVRELRGPVVGEGPQGVVGQGDVVDLLLAAVAVNGHV